MAVTAIALCWVYVWLFIYLAPDKWGAWFAKARKAYDREMKR